MKVLDVRASRLKEDEPKEVERTNMKQSQQYIICGCTGGSSRWTFLDSRCDFLSVFSASAELAPAAIHVHAACHGHKWRNKIAS